MTKIFFTEDDIIANEDLKEIKKEKKFDFAIMRFKEFGLCVKEQDLGCSVEDGNMIIDIVCKELEE